MTHNAHIRTLAVLFMNKKNNKVQRNVPEKENRTKKHKLTMYGYEYLIIYLSMQKKAISLILARQTGFPKERNG